jgi:formate-dependent nitrite reductase membrane component NrfD
VSDVRTYYGQPVLKEPTWKSYIPSYLFLGGLAAGSSLLAAGADIVGDRRLGRVARLTALGAISGSMGALIADLGRPARFHHMLRVFRPTSPMNVGSWLLAAYGPVTGVAAAAELTGRGRAVGRLATIAAAALAPAVATYTGVLISDTAIPAWHDARATLPPLFAAGAAASAGGIAVAFAPESAAARRFAITGALGEGALTSMQHHALAPEVAKAYTTGRAHALQRIATGASVGGAALLVVGAHNRVLSRVAGVTIAAGAAAERFAVFEAGRASAADPIATVAPQRARLADGRS